ncbi:Fanconi anemia group A protein isoform X2 [Fundulus heteroclitus]|uniref:Fanconi anemia group A protein isoform X2 n=1 Tax=Fundulus heteroclitus TaxID=8078 RepID=UPI00165AF2CA|nr:Fanconi anemia group A protein isoform X2 [Fundulus heteroclitus]
MFMVLATAEMSLRSSGGSVSQKRTVSGLLAGRVIKKPTLEDGQQLQEAAIQLLDQHQNLSSLLQELENPGPCDKLCAENGEQNQNQNQAASDANPPRLSALLLGSGLRRQAARLGVSVGALSVQTVLERLMEITEREEEEEERWREMFTSSQRVQLCVLLQSTKELLSQTVLCPKRLWMEYCRHQHPKLEVVYYLHKYYILTLDYMLHSDENVRSWLPPQLKALCGWTPPPEEEETRRLQQKLLSAVVGVLVAAGFEEAAERKLSLLCSSVLDDMLFWLLDIEEKRGEVAERWIQTLDASLCGDSVSPAALQRFFTHCLTQIFTCNTRLTVSDAVALQKEWTLAKTSHCLTSLYCKLAVIFSAEQLLHHLQQVLETHEVNWKHVLCFVSALLVYYQAARPCLIELLSRLLSSAFEGYDLENMITAFLLARQGALEGAGVFPPYSDWFKTSFGGSAGFQASSKKSLVFLLKFLSDLVPFEPPQYLKVHILHPPYVPAKHRNLLMEYVTLAKTRLADLKESVEDMGLYEDVSGSRASSQPQCPAAQDVEKAVSLFGSTGRISATVMEASIFRRPYFLTRFLPALLKPRVLPLKPDARMNFIEALKKADKVPAAQYSSYVDSCQRHRQQNKTAERPDLKEDPLDVLRIQLQELPGLVDAGNDGEMSAQLSRISHTLSVFPASGDELTTQTIVTLNTETPQLPELHLKVVNLILQNFCQCLLTASRANPPNKQTSWGCRFVCVLLDNRPLLSAVMQRLWDLFHHQAASLSPAHTLGLAAFLVHLHASMALGPLVQLVPATQAQAAPLAEAISSAVPCNSHANMLFSLRLCAAAVSYGLCRGEPQQQQDYVPPSLYKKLLYLIPRLFPEARGTAACVWPDEDGPDVLWSSFTQDRNIWTQTVLHLWRHAGFQQLQQTPRYQLCFSEWLHNELRVQRNEDVLSDCQRQEYQQWACLQLYLSRPEEQGGCGGDVKELCSRLLVAIMDIMDQPPSELEKPGSAEPSGTGTCLPDLLSRLQELVQEAELSPGGAVLWDVLFELLSQRCSSSVSITSQLSLQRTLHAWNRVLLVLPAALFFKTKPEGGRTTVDCSQLVEHINQHQRKACSPAGVLPPLVTAHFLKGLLCAAVRCDRPAGELNGAWCQMSRTCPLLAVSAVRWWQQLAPVLFSLWTRLRDGEPPPEQLQLLADCRRWACSLIRGPATRMPPAAVLLCAASLHEACRSCEEPPQNFREVLRSLQPERHAQHQQVLVSLLGLWLKDYLDALLFPQENRCQRSRTFCSELLAVLVDSADWLLIFRSNEPTRCHPVSLTSSEDCTRLMPWAVCSLLQQQSADFLQGALQTPGFLHSALLWYLDVLQLFLEGDTPPSEPKVEPAQILNRTKQFVLGLVSQAPPAALSSGQLRQLECQCAELDPELAAALSVLLEPHSLSPEVDFL